MFPRIPIALLLTAALARAQSDTPLTVDRLTLKGTVAESTQFAGRPAIRLLETDKSRTAAVFRHLSASSRRIAGRPANCVDSATGPHLRVRESTVSGVCHSGGMGESGSKQGNRNSGD